MGKKSIEENETKKKKSPKIEDKKVDMPNKKEEKVNKKWKLIVLV